MIPDSDAPPVRLWAMRGLAARGISFTEVPSDIEAAPGESEDVHPRRSRTARGMEVSAESDDGASQRPRRFLPSLERMGGGDAASHPVAQPEPEPDPESQPSPPAAWVPATETPVPPPSASDIARYRSAMRTHVDEPASTESVSLRRGIEDPEMAWARLKRAVGPAPKYSRLRGDIEGLRAIAILLVLAYHLGVPGVSGGFSGVDVFFVISGFLITSQLVSQVRAGQRPSLLKFYANRVRRLVPVATLVLLFTAVTGWILLPQSQWRELGQDILASAFYFVNWTLAARSVDYLAKDAAASPVQHYWSLAVEEQFYLVWPLLVIGCLLLARLLRAKPVWLLTAALTTVVGGSFYWSIRYAATHPAEAYFVSTTRFWEIGVGALLAIAVPWLAHRVITDRDRRIVKYLALAGLLAVLSAAFVVNTSMAWPGYAALLPVLGTMLVIAAGVADGDNPVARALGAAPLRFLGALSYSIYLWHWPLIIFARELWTTPLDPELGWGYRFGVAVASVGLAWLTGKVLETPIRFGDVRSWQGTLAFRNAAVAILVPGILGVGIWARAPQFQAIVASPVPTVTQSSLAPSASAPPSLGPVKGDYLGALSLVADAGAVGVPALRANLTPALAITKPIQPAPSVADQDLPPSYVTGCQRSRNQATVVGREDCISGDPAGAVRVALVGDSKIDQWQPAVDVLGKRHGWRVQNLSKSGCAFTSKDQYTQCNQYNASLLDSMLAIPPDLLITSSMMFVADSAPGMADYLTQLQGRGTKVLIIADTPAPPNESSVYLCAEKVDDVTECEFETNQGTGTHQLREVHERLTGATMINLNRWICPPGRDTCPVVVGDVFVYRQTSHLSNTYVQTMTPLLERELVAAGVLTKVTIALQP